MIIAITQCHYAQATSCRVLCKFKSKLRIITTLAYWFQLKIEKIIRLNWAFDRMIIGL